MRESVLPCEHVTPVLASHLFEKSLRAVVQDEDWGAFAFHKVCRQHEHTAFQGCGVQFRYPDFPRLLQLTDLLVAQARVHRKECDPPALGHELVE